MHLLIARITIFSDFWKRIAMVPLIGKGGEGILLPRTIAIQPMPPQNCVEVTEMNLDIAVQSAFSPVSECSHDDSTACLS